MCTSSATKVLCCVSSESVGAPGLLLLPSLIWGCRSNITICSRWGGGQGGRAGDGGAAGDGFGRAISLKARACDHPHVVSHGACGHSNNEDTMATCMHSARLLPTPPYSCIVWTCSALGAPHVHTSQWQDSLAYAAPACAAPAVCSSTATHNTMHISTAVPSTTHLHCCVHPL